MTKKDLKQVEKIVHKILDDMIYGTEDISIQETDETIFPVIVLDKIEDYLGHPIGFMGIS